MRSIIAEGLNGRFAPSVFLRSSTVPENALSMEAGQKGSCMMGLYARVVAEGATAVFDAETCGCGGAIVALGFGNEYTADAFAEDMYSALFTRGLPDARDTERYRQIMDHLPESDRAKFLRGERLFPDKESALHWIRHEVPVYTYQEPYAVLKPLTGLHEDETPLSVIFTVNPVELSALVVIAASISGSPCMCVTPAGSGCSMFASMVRQQAESPQPSAVLGLLDLSARPHVRPLIPDDYLSYSVPWRLFLDLEKAANEGIFTASIWADAVSGRVA